MKLVDDGMDDLFGDRDRKKAREARDDGIKKVLDHNEQWRINAMDGYRRMPRGWIGTGEDIRFLLAPVIGFPRHPNGWGGIMNAALRRGWYTPTGKWIAPQSVKSHSRPIREYQRR